MHLLVIEDERALCETIVRDLRRLAYSVDFCHDGEEALELLYTEHYDLVLLDLNLPGKDGMTVLRTLRQTDHETRVLILSARSGVEDKVAGLDAGADDYLPKPFAASEFLARVRALTRRSNTYASSILSFGNVTLDCSQYLLKTILGEVRLNNKEYQLMELFFLHPRQVFSSEHLMETVWSLDSEAEMDVVWTYIGFLRKKLRQIGADIEIRTIRGAGYALEEMPC